MRAVPEMSYKMVSFFTFSQYEKSKIQDSYHSPDAAANELCNWMQTDAESTGKFPKHTGFDAHLKFQYRHLKWVLCDVARWLSHLQQDGDEWRV